MHVGIIELLRCPVDHVESALVASATRQVERQIMEGWLGCPVCAAEYPIHHGIADMRRDRVRVLAHPVFGPAPNEDAAVRLAAQLDLTEARRLVLLAGDYAAAAPQLAVMFDPAVLVVGVPLEREAHLSQHASVLRIDTIVPLVRSALHGAAIDAAHSGTLGLEQVSALLKPRGRLVAPSSSTLPPDLKELARDSVECVAERTADASSVVELRRAVR